MRKIPFCSIQSLMLFLLYGKNENSIFEPSSGGIGIKLNVASTRLINTIIVPIYKKDSPSEVRIPKRISNPKNRAISIFERGPAIATLASPHF